MVESTARSQREACIVLAKEKDRSEWPNTERVVICERCGTHSYLAYPKKYPVELVLALYTKDYPCCPNGNGPQPKGPFGTHKICETVEYFGWELGKQGPYFYTGLSGVMREGNYFKDHRIRRLYDPKTRAYERL